MEALQDDEDGYQDDEDEDEDEDEDDEGPEGDEGDRNDGIMEGAPGTGSSGQSYWLWTPFKGIVRFFASCASCR